MKVDGQEVTKLTMREPTLDDHIAHEKLDGTEAQNDRAMISNLCMVSPEDLGKIPLRDWLKLQRAFSGFLV